MGGFTTQHGVLVESRPAGNRGDRFQNPSPHARAGGSGDGGGNAKVGDGRISASTNG